MKSKASENGNTDLVKKCDSYLVGDVISTMKSYFILYIKSNVSDKDK